MTLAVAVDETNNVGDALPSRLDALAILVNEIRAALGATIDDTLDTLGDGDSTLEDVLNAMVNQKTREIPMYLVSGFAASGTPVAAVEGSRTPYVAFDAAGTETWAIPVKEQIPPSWTTVNADLLWYGDGAGAGNVVWLLQALTVAAGDNAATDTIVEFGGNTTDAAGAENVVQAQDLGSAIIPATNHLVLLLSRIGADAADTLANDAGAILVLLSKGS